MIYFVVIFAFVMGVTLGYALGLHQHQNNLQSLSDQLKTSTKEQ